MSAALVEHVDQDVPGDVGGVCGMPLFGRHVVLDEANLESQEVVDGTHPCRVASGQIVVDGHHVDAVAGERVEVGRHRGNEGLAFTGLHLGDHALVQCCRTDHLDVVVPLSEHSFGRFTDRGKGLDLDVLHGLAVGEPALEFCCLGF